MSDLPTQGAERPFRILLLLLFRLFLLLDVILIGGLLVYGGTKGKL
jgi:hypothetical protein